MNSALSRPICLLILWLLAGVGLAHNGQSEESAVKQVVSDFAAAWDRHDVEAMVAQHTDDVNFINIFGAWKKGRGQVQAILQQGHRPGGPFIRSKMKLYEQQVTFLAPNVAVVHNNMELMDSPPETLGLCHSVRVIVKINGKWLIRDFQNTVIRSGDPAAGKH